MAFANKCSVSDDATCELHEYVSRVIRKDVIKELLEELGEIPASLSEKIEKEYSMDRLKKWFKLAAKVKSIEEFIEKM